MAHYLCGLIDLWSVCRPSHIKLTIDLGLFLRIDVMGDESNTAGELSVRM